MPLYANVRNPCVASETDKKRLKLQVNEVYRQKRIPSVVRIGGRATIA